MASVTPSHTHYQIYSDPTRGSDTIVLAGWLAGWRDRCTVTNTSWRLRWGRIVSETRALDRMTASVRCCGYNFLSINKPGLMRELERKCRHQSRGKELYIVVWFSLLSRTVEEREQMVSFNAH